jgi:hypothetical protein
LGLSSRVKEMDLELALRTASSWHTAFTSSHTILFMVSIDCIAFFRDASTCAWQKQIVINKRHRSAPKLAQPALEPPALGMQGMSHLA